MINAVDIKKAILRMFLLAALFFSATVVTAVPSLAQDFEIVDKILVKYNGSGEDVAIPATVEKIFSNAFLNNSQITTVNIPEGVFEIGDNAFDGCSQLQKIYFPSSLRYIGKGAFANCTELKELNLPTGLSTIDEGAFSGCQSLKQVTIPKTVTTIVRAAFDNCTGIEYFSVASENTAYTEIDGVLYTSDKKVLLAYPLARKDTSFRIPDGVMYLERSSFAYQPTLSEIIFPDSLREIRPFTFRNCPGLREITLPETLEHVYEYSFMYCLNLNRIYYKGDTTQTQVHTFDGDYSVTIYANEGSKAQNHAFLYNMNWLPLHDTETILLPKDKSISHED